MTFKEKIKDRLETGFKNWNGGYETWIKWCETLYEPDCYYNIQIGGPQKRLTLKQYEEACKGFMENFDLQLGGFDNMIIQEDGWAAIRYKNYITNKKTGEKFTQNTMEFVLFKDNPDPIGARVVEGWALSDLTVG